MHACFVIAKTATLVTVDKIDYFDLITLFFKILFTVIEYSFLTPGRFFVQNEERRI
jgi:hypothetical protein